MTEMMQIPFFVDVRLEVRCEAFPSPRTSDAQEQQNLLFVIGIVGDRLNNARLLCAFLDVTQSFFYSAEERIHALSNDIARRSFITRCMTSRRDHFIISYQSVRDDVMTSQSNSNGLVTALHESS